MGAINYKTSKYITLGLKDDDFDYNDFNFEYEEAKNILEKYNFEVLQVKILSGYYNGFSIDIDFDYIYFDDTVEKNNTLKEATQLKKLLFELCELGLFACFPGWITTFLDYENTKKEIKKAIKDLKIDIKSTKTYSQYKKTLQSR